MVDASGGTPLWTKTLPNTCRVCFIQEVKRRLLSGIRSSATALICTANKHFMMRSIQYSVSMLAIPVVYYSCKYEKQHLVSFLHQVTRVEVLWISINFPWIFPSMGIDSPSMGIHENGMEVHGNRFSIDGDPWELNPGRHQFRPLPHTNLAQILSTVLAAACAVLPTVSTKSASLSLLVP